MKIKVLLGLLLIWGLNVYSQKKVLPPAPFGALPSDRQLAWHEMEMYNMIEFSTIQYLEEKDWG